MIASAIQIEPIRGLDRLAELAPQWQDLAPQTPMLTPEWLSTWWRHYSLGGRGHGRGRELLVLAAFDPAGRLAGLAPWYTARSPLEGRVVRPLGSGEVCSDYLTIPCRPGLESNVCEALADWLADTGRGGAPKRAWNLLELDGIEANDQTTALLRNALARRGAITDVRPALACWRLELPASWEDLLSRLSKSHRKRCRRLTRRLDDTDQFQVHWVRSQAEFERGFAILVGLHRRLWQQRKEKSAFEGSRFTKFHADVARRLLHTGQLRMFWLELEGRPVAAEYQFVADGVIYAYQSGRDPAADDEQPGNLAMLASLRAAVAEGYRAIDFMRGDEPYKAHWRAEPRETSTIRIRPGRPQDRVRHQVWRAGRTAADWLRAGRDIFAGVGDKG